MLRTTLCPGWETVNKGNSSKPTTPIPKNLAAIDLRGRSTNCDSQFWLLMVVGCTDPKLPHSTRVCTTSFLSLFILVRRRFYGVQESELGEMHSMMYITADIQWICAPPSKSPCETYCGRSVLVMPRWAAGGVSNSPLIVGMRAQVDYFSRIIKIYMLSDNNIIGIIVTILQKIRSCALKSRECQHVNSDRVGLIFTLFHQFKFDQLSEH